MTTQELTSAFDYKFVLDTYNFRVFENDDLRVTVHKDGENRYWVLIEHTSEDLENDSFHADAEKAAKFINEKNLELQDYTEGQQLEINLNRAPEVEAITKSTYTCKNGYEMSIFVIDFEELCTFDKSKRFDLEDLVKSLRGWFDYRKKNIVLRNRMDADKVLKFIYA